MRGLIVGTGPSLRPMLPLLRRFKGLVFTCNNTFEDVRTDVWLACDPAWHRYYSPVRGDFDRWHWDASICNDYGYRYVRGVWMVDGVAYSRDEHNTPPGPVGGLWLDDKSSISLNHCSGAQLLNLACNQYECSEVILIGHDFHYPEGQPRHYFNDLSETPGEYPAKLRKFSLFDKQGKGDDLLAVYKRIAVQEGRPEIINCTPGSALKHFPMGNLADYLQ